MKAFYGILIGCIIGLVVITIHYSYVLNDYKKRIEAVEKQPEKVIEIEKLQPCKNEEQNLKVLEKLTLVIKKNNEILHKLYMLTDRGQIEALENDARNAK